MRKGVEILGARRILFGTDVPFGTFKYSALEAEKAFADSPDILERVMYRNSAELMRLEV
jgi:predicted TIM-barrel fold metal-dependent hydrolase